MANEKVRCSWVNLNNHLLVSYHDLKWGEPVFDDQMLFAYLVLEMMQAGLSWEIILNKEEAFRKALDNYSVPKICLYDEEKIKELLNNKDIIRNRKKILAVINNAQIFKSIQDEYGSFAKFIWHFTNNKIIYHDVKFSNYYANIIACDLQKRGMKFVGQKIIYAYLEAIGIFNNHEINCFKYQKDNRDNNLYKVK